MWDIVHGIFVPARLNLGVIKEFVATFGRAMEVVRPFGRKVKASYLCPATKPCLAPRIKSSGRSQKNPSGDQGSRVNNFV